MDTRYLKRRGQRWYFQLAVPGHLQTVVGKKVLLEALGTSELKEAQQARWRHLAAAQARFEAMSDPDRLTSTAIEREAQATMKRLLREAERAARRGEPLQWVPGDMLAEGIAPEDEVGLVAAWQRYDDALAHDDFQLVGVEATAIIKSLDLDIAPGSRVHAALCRSQLAANREAVAAWLAAVRGDAYEPPPRLSDARGRSGAAPEPTVPAPVVALAPSSGGGLRVSEAALRCVADNQALRRGRWTNQTRRQYEATFRMFAAFVGDRPIAEIVRSDATRFVDALSRLDPDWRRQDGADETDLRALLDGPGRASGLSAKTLNRYVATCSALFRWAARNGLYASANPFAELYRMPQGRGGRAYQPFSTDELNRLFRAPAFTGRPWHERVHPKRHSVETALAWAPLIGLFSGLRSNEICQLSADDIRYEDGTWVFAIRGRRSRLVPIHSALVRCGLPDYVGSVQGQGSGLLFPALRPGGPDGKRNWYFTDAFRSLRRRQGIVRAGVRLGFQSFRANVRGAFAEARVPEHEAIRLLGHERSHAHAGYTLAADLRTLRDTIEKLSYPGLNLAHLSDAASTDPH